MKNTPTDCTAATELFPWYLNGTLGEEEAAALEAHLETCPRCRQEHRETAFAAATYNAHPAADQLVRYAFHDLPMGPERSLLEEHLRICSPCSEELKLIEASRDRQHEEEAPEVDIPPSGVEAPLPFRRPRQAAPAAGWRLGAIAASLIAVLAAGYWLFSLEGPDGRPGPGSSGPATAGLEGPGTDLPGALPNRAGAAFAIAAVRPGTLQAGTADAPLLELPPGASEVELTLRFADAVPGGSLELEVLDSLNRRIWRGGALTSAGGRDLTANLPTEALPDGDLVLRIRGREGSRQVTVARSPLRVERLRR